MNVLKTKETDNENYYVKEYKFDNTIQIHSLIPILKQFETDEVKLGVCHCNTFDSEGSPLYYRYDNIDNIQNIANAPSPYVNFSIDYCNRENSTYCFSLLTSVNSDVVKYIVDKKKLGVEMTSRFKLRR